jgi:hypothetical protein
VRTDDLLKGSPELAGLPVGFALAGAKADERRVLLGILALTAAIWHNDPTGQPVMRSLVAYDH